MVSHNIVPISPVLVEKKRLDDENERRRIDAGNPNLRKSLVTFTEGSWRVGGVGAFSPLLGLRFDSSQSGA